MHNAAVIAEASGVATVTDPLEDPEQVRYIYMQHVQDKRVKSAWQLCADQMPNDVQSNAVHWYFQHHFQSRPLGLIDSHLSF